MSIALFFLLFNDISEWEMFDIEKYKIKNAKTKYVKHNIYIML